MKGSEMFFGRQDLMLQTRRSILVALDGYFDAIIPFRRLLNLA